ncbi:MAG: hypothetical protein HQM12_20110 [SAR324 cluster bacterium]|nr:hypothetical protein [SAR324 cluster bacterium]
MKKEVWDYVDQKGQKNRNENLIYRGFIQTERYLFDFDVCTSKQGWNQYDTHQDAWYFGIWYHPEKRLIFTYAEGDTTLIECQTNESFQSELKSMNAFYGGPPVVCVAIDMNGTVTRFLGDRPDLQ